MESGCSAFFALAQRSTGARKQLNPRAGVTDSAAAQGRKGKGIFDDVSRKQIAVLAEHRYPISTCVLRRCLMHPPRKVSRDNWEAMLRRHHCEKLDDPNYPELEDIEYWVTTWGDVIPILHESDGTLDQRSLLTIVTGIKKTAPPEIDFNNN